jgi:hypothetical protein
LQAPQADERKASGHTLASKKAGSNWSGKPQQSEQYEVCSKCLSKHHETEKERGTKHDTRCELPSPNGELYPF